MERYQIGELSVRKVLDNLHGGLSDGPLERNNWTIDPFTGKGGEACGVIGEIAGIDETTNHPERDNIEGVTLLGNGKLSVGVVVVGAGNKNVWRRMRDERNVRASLNDVPGRIELEALVEGGSRVKSSSGVKIVEVDSKSIANAASREANWLNSKSVRRVLSEKKLISYILSSSVDKTSKSEENERGQHGVAVLDDLSERERGCVD